MNSEYRIGDRERGEASNLLQKAYEQGYIDITEFNERLDVVNEAKFLSNLRQPLDDLPFEEKYKLFGDVNRDMINAGTQVIQHRRENDLDVYRMYSREPMRFGYGRTARNIAIGVIAAVLLYSFVNSGAYIFAIMVVVSFLMIGNLRKGN